MKHEVDFSRVISYSWFDFDDVIYDDYGVGCYGIAPDICEWLNDNVGKDRWKYVFYRLDSPPRYHMVFENLDDAMLFRLRYGITKD